MLVLLCYQKLTNKWKKKHRTISMHTAHCTAICRFELIWPMKCTWCCCSNIPNAKLVAHKNVKRWNIVSIWFTRFIINAIRQINSQKKKWMKFDGMCLAMDAHEIHVLPFATQFHIKNEIEFHWLWHWCFIISMDGWMNRY